MHEPIVWLELLFALLLRAVWCAGILLLLVWIVDRAGQKWFSPRVRYALWLLVAARLLMLWTPTSSLSLVGQIEKSARYVMSLPRTQLNEPRDVKPSPLASDLAEVKFEPAIMLETSEWDSSLATEPPSAFWSAWTLWTLVAITWGFGALLFAAKLLADFWRLRMAMSKMVASDSASAVGMLRKLESELGVRRRVSLLVCENLASPAVTGVMRPSLLLPKIFLDQLTPTELEHVFRHELTHVKRRDVLVNWVLAWLGAVYWFFPLMRFLLSQLRKTRELACDAAVLAKATAAERAAYGKTLVRVLEMAAMGDRPVLTFTVGVAGMVWPMGNTRRESRMMRERLELVVGGRAAGKFAVAIAAALLGLLTLVGFTDGQEKKETTAAADGVLLPLLAKDAGSRAEDRWIETSYDFTSVRKRFEKSPEHFKIPAATTTAPSPTAPPAKVDAVASARQLMREWVDRVIRESGWTSRMAPTIRWVEEDKAIISHSHQSHERLTRALKALESTAESQYVFEFSVGTLDAEDFGKVNVKDYRVATHGLTDASAELAAPKSASAASHSEETISRRIPSHRLFLSDAETKRLQAELQAIFSFSRLSAPKVTTLSTQSVRVTTGEVRPFVSGFARNDNGADQPHMESIFCGLDVQLQSIALGDATIWLRLHSRHTEVIGVDEEELPGSTLKIQSPKIWLMSQSAGLEMKLGDTLAIFTKASGREGKKDQVLALFVTVREAHLPPLPEPLGPSNKAQNTAAPPEKAKHEKLALPIADISFFKSAKPVDEKSKDIESRLLRSEVRRMIDLFKELNPDFVATDSGRKIEVNYADSTIVFSGPMTLDDRSRVQEFYYYMKQQVEKAREAKDPADMSMAPNPGTKRAQATGRNLELTREKAFSGSAEPRDGQLTTVSYELAELPMMKLLLPGFGKGQTYSQARIAKATSNITMSLAKSLPEICQKEGVILQPIFTDLKLIVSASAADQEKIAEVLNHMKKMTSDQATRVALTNDFDAQQGIGIKEGEFDSFGNVIQSHDVASQPLLAGFATNMQDKDPRMDAAVAQMQKLRTIIEKTIPAFGDRKPGVGIAFMSNLTMSVQAPPEDQEKIAELLKALSKLSKEEAEKEAAKEAATPRDR